MGGNAVDFVALVNVQLNVVRVFFPHHWLALIPIMGPMLDGFFQKEEVQIFPPPVGVSQIVPWAGGDHELFLPRGTWLGFWRVAVAIKSESSLQSNLHCWVRLLPTAPSGEGMQKVQFVGDCKFLEQ